MGLFGFKSDVKGKGIIDSLQWDPQDNSLVVWKFPESNLSNHTQVVVRESQEAVFYYSGQFADLLGPGRHSLETANIPILRKLFGIPFGGVNPFTADVWYINKTCPLNIDWKTNEMKYLDPDYGQMIPIFAEGRYGLKIKDSLKLLGKLVGAKESYTHRELTDQFMGPLVAKTKSAIINVMQTNNYGVMQISGLLDNLSGFLKEPLSQFWDEYGLELTEFYVTSVDVDKSSAEGQAISKAMAERSAQNIAGYTWQQAQGFKSVNNAVNHSNGGIGLMGAAMMMGGGISGNAAIGGQMMSAQPGGQAGFARAQQMQNMQMGMGAQRGMGVPMGGAMGGGMGQKEVFCSNCSKKFPATSRFCPFCGDVYNPCPVCGADNATDAKRCSTCGASLAVTNQVTGMMQSNNCPRCGSPAVPGTKFCQTCGNKLV